MDIILFAPILISIPLVIALRKNISWLRFILVLLFLLSIFVIGPIGFFLAFLPIYLQKQNKPKPSSTQELKLKLSKIILLIAIVLNTVLILFFFVQFIKGCIFVLDSFTSAISSLSR
jgi:hypothetical protein